MKIEAFEHIANTLRPHPLIVSAKWHGYYAGMHLIAFFFKVTIRRMKEELSQKRKNSLPLLFF